MFQHGYRILMIMIKMCTFMRDNTRISKVLRKTVRSMNQTVLNDHINGFRHTPSRESQANICMVTRWQYLSIKCDFFCVTVLL